MKKRPIIIIAAVAALSVSVLLLSRNTVAYLMDTEAADNVVQIGQVEVSLDEGSFDPTSSAPIVEIGRIVNKSPKLENTGKNDEYVFLKVSVPKENVTLLYETSGANYKEGAKIPPGTPQEVEIFKILANNKDSNNQALDVADIPDSTDPKKIIFNYHNGGTSAEGWVYLGALNDGYTNFRDNSVIENNKYKIYYFGYNKVLAKGETTKTLFDKVQLKSFIDREVNSNGSDKDVKIKVEAFAIQSDDLGISVSNTKNITSDELKSILKVVDNKQ